MSNSRRPVSAFDIDLAREINAAQRRRRAGHAFKTCLAYAAVVAALIVITASLAAFVAQFDHLATGVLGLCILVLWAGVIGCLYLFTK
jgi:hypothetical protein